MDKFSFFKMHGLSNDFIILDFRTNTFEIDNSTIKLLSNRQSGIGCDQVVIIKESSDKLADCQILIYNNDGSESETCGNAIRCVGKVIMDELQKTEVIIETKAGLMDVEIDKNGLLSVDMGIAKFQWDDIPLSHPIDCSNLKLNYKHLKGGFAINIGNPHVIFFTKTLDEEILENECKKVSQLKVFPKGVNINLVKITDFNSIRLVVYERGSGFTKACGSGACASVKVSSHLKLTSKNVMVTMPGGKLEIEILNDDHIIMLGSVNKVFEGILNMKNFRRINEK